MQRALAYALAPSPALPLRFLLTAPWFAVLAGLLLCGAGPGAFDSRWSPALLGATHLITLGYLTMAMTGAMLQLIPVVGGHAVRASLLAWRGLAGGALLLATALALQLPPLFMPAGVLLAGAIALQFSAVLAALARPVPPGALPMVRGMRAACAGLAATLATGLLLAAALGGMLNLPLLALVDLHAAWGLVGWVAMLVAGVAFQVIPMFQSTRSYPALLARWGTWLLAGLLLAWSASGMGWVATLAAALLAAFAVLSARLLATRRQVRPDGTTLYWRLALASLGASALLYLAPRQWPVLTGVVFIVGFAMGAVNGMLYKIVPFMLWYHLQQLPRARKGDVPPIRQILPEHLARRQFCWHALALAALLGALAAPVWLLRPAAALLAFASLLLALDLGRAALRCRRIRCSVSLRKRADGRCREW